MPRSPSGGRRSRQDLRQGLSAGDRSHLELPTKMKESNPAEQEGSQQERSQPPSGRHRSTTPCENVPLLIGVAPFDDPSSPAEMIRPPGRCRHPPLHDFELSKIVFHASGKLSKWVPSMRNHCFWN
jgi:hypothetical protein